MEGVNSVVIIGNVGNVTDLHGINATDKKVLNISVATTENFIDSANNKKDDTQWHNIVLWNGLAEIGKRLIYKGCLLYIEGKLNYRKKSDGTPVTEIVAKNIRVLSKKPTTNGSCSD